MACNINYIYNLNWLFAWWAQRVDRVIGIKTVQIEIIFYGCNEEQHIYYQFICFSFKTINSDRNFLRTLLFFNSFCTIYINIKVIYIDIRTVLYIIEPEPSRSDSKLTHHTVYDNKIIDTVFGYAILKYDVAFFCWQFLHKWRVDIAVGLFSCRYTMYMFLFVRVPPSPASDQWNVSIVRMFVYIYKRNWFGAADFIGLITSGLFAGLFSPPQKSQCIRNKIISHVSNSIEGKITPGL